MGALQLVECILFALMLKAHARATAHAGHQIIRKERPPPVSLLEVTSDAKLKDSQGSCASCWECQAPHDLFEGSKYFCMCGTQREWYPNERTDREGNAFCMSGACVMRQAPECSAWGAQVCRCDASYRWQLNFQLASQLEGAQVQAVTSSPTKLTSRTLSAAERRHARGEYDLSNIEAEQILEKEALKQTVKEVLKEKVAKLKQVTGSETPLVESLQPSALEDAVHVALEGTNSDDESG